MAFGIFGYVSRYFTTWPIDDFLLDWARFAFLVIPAALILWWWAAAWR